MKNHYIDEVNVIIDGDKSETLTIMGAGYNPNIVKDKASRMVQERYPDSRIEIVILSHKDISVEEYKAIAGSNPPWLGNIE